MALRKVGKIYHILYRDLHGKVKTRTTGLTDKERAKLQERVWMTNLKAERFRHKQGINLTSQLITPSRKQLKLLDALSAYEKYATLPLNTTKNWQRFFEAVPVKYMHEVTPDIAFNYLETYYADAAGKTYNNNKNSLNNVFKTLSIESGMDRSPFSLIRSRKNDSKHQRAFTESEFQRIFNAAKEPWKTACLITWFTGLRQESAFNLRYDHIKDDVITIMPGKTARFNRSVRIPLHPRLNEHFSTLPPSLDGRVTGFDQQKRTGGSFQTYFGKLLRSLKICDNEIGIVKYNSIRNSFIDRCRIAGIPEHAIRGMAGHIKSEMTDLYSNEIESAMKVKKL